MSANRTSTKTRACRGKKAHATRQEALEHMRRMIRKGASPVVLNVYRCPVPGAHPEVGSIVWHVGHRMPGRRK